VLHWQVSVSKSGALYFSGQKDKDHYGRGDIYCARLVDGRYGEPVNLGPAINTTDSESQPFIAPDESFILFWRAPGQIPTAYVSFKGQNGQWLPAVKFDLPWAPGGLMISPGGKYLFAAARWKSAKLLDDLRPEGLAQKQVHIPAAQPDPTINGKNSGCGTIVTWSISAGAGSSRPQSRPASWRPSEAGT
jgi:hypothetical protein